MEEICKQLEKERHEFCIAIENWKNNLNIGSIVRSANAFGAKCVYIIGNKRWNKRGAMVTDRYQKIYHVPTAQEFVTMASDQNLDIIAIDNLPGSLPVETTPMPKNAVLVFGQEGPGLCSTIVENAKMMLHITQYGSTRSINAAAAAAIIMHSWIRQHLFSQSAPPSLEPHTSHNTHTPPKPSHPPEPKRDTHRLPCQNGENTDKNPNHWNSTCAE